MTPNNRRLQRVVGVRRVANGCVGVVVAFAVAVPDGHELRQVLYARLVSREGTARRNHVSGAAADNGRVA
jgi:hypothetical protein